jgi:nicotinate-nucleotide pyrophosphorylase (carboxylating)
VSAMGVLHDPPLHSRSVDASLLASAEPLLRRALEEDVGAGDVTSETVIPAAAQATARLIAKESGVVAGVGICARVFELVDAAVRSRRALADGTRVGPGTVVLELEGPARALLAGERTALNLVQRLSGIASRTRAYVDRVQGRARILDTRKTTPTLRGLEKYAVRCGGGENHRFGLSDQAMLKNNHVDVAGKGVLELVRELRAVHGGGLVITAEARDEREALEAVRGGADVVLLDNLGPDELARLVPRVRAAARERERPLEIEASGGITLDNVDAVARSGVDRISIGELTHSAPALDLSLRLEPRA